MKYGGIIILTTEYNLTKKTNWPDLRKQEALTKPDKSLKISVRD